MLGFGVQNFFLAFLLLCSLSSAQDHQRSAAESLAKPSVAETTLRFLAPALPLQVP